MWRRIPALAVSIALVIPAAAQSSDASLWRPNPVTVALTIGQWLLKDRQKVYYVRVEAGGQDEHSALTSAFRLAVSQALGSLVLVETEVQNQQVVRQDIINYSSGYVDDHKILHRRSENGLIVVTVDVWVKHSRLSERLLNQSRGQGEVNGSQTRIQSETLTHARQQGDRVLSAVLGDFPNRAFVVSAGPTRTTYSDRRNRNIELSFRVEWDRDYLESLREALGQIAQNANAGHCLGRHAQRCDYQGYVTIKGRPGTHGWSRTAAFDDRISLDLVYQNLIESRPAVLIRLRGNDGREVYRGCARFSELDNIISGVVPNDRMLQPTENGMLINAWLALDAKVPINLSSNSPDAETASFEIVRSNRCPQ
jgi:hypothetical protein